jgi:hypothetical protein
MDYIFSLQVTGAVILANAACFAFFMGAMECSRQQKRGVADDQLPLWVYPCLIVAPFLMAVGAYLWA